MGSWSDAAGPIPLRMLAWPVLLAAAGCASAAPASTEGCTSDLAAAVQPIAEAVDSARLQRDVSRLLRPGGGLVLASFSYDSSGARSDVTVRAASLEERTGSAVREVVTTAAPDRAAPDTHVYLVLGDDAGPAVRRVRGFAGCAPTMLRRDWLAQELVAVARNLRLQRPVTAMLWVQVQTDGTAGEVQIRQPSGNPQFDQAAVLVMKRATFRPAMVEGIPMMVWAQFPVSAAPAGGGTQSR